LGAGGSRRTATVCAIAARKLSWGADPIADGIVTTPAPEAGDFTNGEYVSRVSLGELEIGTTAQE